MSELLTFEHRFDLIESAPGEGRRTITGLAVPWNVDATVSSGQTVDRKSTRLNSSHT